jgi:hypothetical protein
LILSFKKVLRRVADEDVHSPHGRGCMIGQCPDAGAIAEVHGMVKNFLDQGVCFKLPGSLFQHAFPARRDHHPGTGTCQRPSHVVTDTRPAARHKRGLSGQIEIFKSGSFHRDILNDIYFAGASN